MYSNEFLASYLLVCFEMILVQDSICRHICVFFCSLRNINLHALQKCGQHFCLVWCKTGTFYIILPKNYWNVPGIQFVSKYLRIKSKNPYFNFHLKYISTVYVKNTFQANVLHKSAFSYFYRVGQTLPLQALSQITRWDWVVFPFYLLHRSTV